MSTKLHDFASQALLYQASVPGTRTSTVTGASLDMITGDGNCFAIQQVGVVSGTGGPTLSGKIQESDDGTTFTDISGATFTDVTTSTSVQKIRFQRSKRYLAYIGTIAGTTSPSFAMAALIGEQLKTL